MQLFSLPCVKFYSDADCEIDLNLILQAQSPGIIYFCQQGPINKAVQIKQ